MPYHSCAQLKTTISMWSPLFQTIVPTTLCHVGLHIVPLHSPHLCTFAYMVPQLRILFPHFLSLLLSTRSLNISLPVPVHGTSSSSNLLEEGLAKIINILGLVGCKVFVPTTQFCCFSMKVVLDNI